MPSLSVASQVPLPETVEAAATPQAAPGAAPSQPPSESPQSVPIYDISGEKPVLGSIDPSEVTESLASGKFSLPQGTPVPVVSPDGEHGTIDPSEAPEAFKNGYRYATPQDIEQAKFSTPGQQLMAGAEGLAQGLAGPLAPALQKFYGAKPENIEKRARYNPGTHYATEALGLVAPAIATAGTSAAARLGIGAAADILPAVAKASKFTQAGILEKAGSAAAGALGLGAEGAGAASEIAAAAARGATEMALLQTGDETTKLLLNDPHQSAQTAAASVGLAALMGGAGGAALGAISPLWKATFGNKLGQVAEDFKGRINEHLTNPEPVEAMTKELQDHYGAITDMADEVYGAKGLKAQDIEKSMPDSHPGMLKQAQEMNTKLQSTIDQMVQKPNSYPGRLVSKIQGDAEAFQAAVSNAKSPAEMFNAAQDLKQAFQGYSKYEKFVKPVDEAYDFVQKAKSLAHDFRTALEDSSVWGKAADRQQSINKAFKEYLPTLKDFESKFTTEVNGVRQVDPGKVNTYLSQIDKPNGTIKKQMLENFLKQSDHYKKVIDQTHVNLGIENPLQNTPLNITRGSLAQRTTGGKLADIFINRGLSEAAGRGMAASAGGTVGHMTGIGGGFGALIGEHTFGPLLTSILPALVKPLLKLPSNGEALKAAAEYGTAVAKGEMLASRAAKNLFKSNAAVLTESQMPKERDRTRLEKILKVVRTDPNTLMTHSSGATALGHYAPDHTVALSQLSASATNYLNSIRPKTDKNGPLDGDIKPSPVQTASYNNALNIAHQPLIVLAKIKSGTLTPQDLTHLNALYPNLYQGLKQKVANEMIEATHKGQIIPYNIRLSASMFLGSALDSTMTPAAILSAQPTPPQSQPQSPQKGPKRGTATLNKLPGQYKTKTQEAESDSNSRE